MLTPLKKRNDGFALVIALTLMAFVLLLLLAITTFTKVESQNATNQRTNTLARQNALLAVNIALGQMQKYTGADQRTTATADLQNGAGVPNPKWLGVYGNNKVADYDRLPDAITPAAPILLNWMVSGNEAESYNASSSAADFGRITATPDPANIKNQPTSAATLTNATPTSTLTIGNAEARLLVGPNSVESANATSDYVVAPLVDIDSDSNQSGRYAWWVGDEGAKAKVNLQPSYLAQDAPTDQLDFQRFAFLTAQRSGIELVDKNDTTPIGTAYDFRKDSLGTVQSLDLLPYVGGDASAINDLTTAISYRFHDLTTNSFGVLSDTYAGGLKKDLTADIAGATGSPLNSDPLFPPLSPNDIVPTWGQVRGYATQNGSNTDPILPSDDSPGIFPVINMACFGMDFFMAPYMDASESPAVITEQFQMAMYPVIVLWNPHNVTINAANYEVGFHLNNLSANAANSYFMIEWNEGGGWSTIDNLDLYNGTWSSELTSGQNFIRFKIQAADIPPGESQIYTLPAYGDPYQAGQNTLLRTDAALGNISNYVTWTSDAIRSSITEAIKDKGINNAGTVRVRGFNPADRAQSFTVALAQPGGLSTLTNTTNWYQAVLDARPGRQGSVAGGRITLLPDTAIGALPQVVSPGATNTFRIQMQMEARGNWNGNPGYIGSLNTGRTRWLVTGNPRAPIIRNTNTENIGYNRGNTVYGANLQLYDYSTNRDPLFPVYGYTNGSLTEAGRGQETNASKYRPTVLFDHLEAPEDLLSMGQLQHAIASPFGFYPTYTFGNSLADVRLARNQHYQLAAFSEDFSTTLSQPLYDLSWHLNRSLWDRYFISGVPTAWTNSDITASRPLPNSRIAYYGTPDVAAIDQTESNSDAYQSAAANLWIDGGFNVNSTSVQAWRAVITAAYNLPQNNDYADTSDTIASISAIPRFSRNLSQTGYASTMQAQSDSNTQSALTYLGNRGLLLPFNGSPPATIDTIVDALAQNIVSEIRQRGPFLSLADFTNRSLTLDASGIKGTLQAAIDNATNPTQVNADAWTNTGAVLSASDKPIAAWNTEHYLGGEISGGYSTRFANAPKFLTQADLLSFIGPSLSARSDTFKIRSYGETLNSSSGKVNGRAWCEAIIQRIPEYVDSSDEPTIAPQDLTSSINKQFGRRYKVVSLRWLDASEI